MSCERKDIIVWINQAMENGARQKNACGIVGISSKTFQRWVKEKNKHDGRTCRVQTPGNKLTSEERQKVIDIANSAEYADLAPCQIVPRLADKGMYIASESTFYRVLKAEYQLAHRNKSKPDKNKYKPKALIASAPNQVYTWDITYLPSSVKGCFFYLYLVLDVYSRKIVGWQIHDKELSELAADLMTDICLREGVKQNQVTLHSDNGSPMKGATMLATLQELGVVPSFSRPSVSNDNPYSESIFRTLKYRPEYPEKAFENLTAARVWVQGFESWYNCEHRHSGIKFVTPEQRHTGQDFEILKNRKLVYILARMQNPSRWSGDLRNWDHVGEVYLNPEKSKSEIKQNQVA